MLSLTLDDGQQKTIQRLNSFFWLFGRNCNASVWPLLYTFSIRPDQTYFTELTRSIFPGVLIETRKHFRDVGFFLQARAQ